MAVSVQQSNLEELRQRVVQYRLACGGRQQFIAKLAAEGGPELGHLAVGPVPTTCMEKFMLRRGNSAWSPAEPLPTAHRALTPWTDVSRLSNGFVWLRRLRLLQDNL
jgi:hypothetical protein